MRVVQRIVGGSLKGRKLLALPKGVEGLRPSSSRVRGAIFDRLQGEIRGARVLDAFAGSGALGIEALSRGAAQVVAIERAHRVHQHLDRQLRALDLLGPVRLVKADVVDWLGRKGRPHEPFDLVFADPPYARSDLYPALLDALVEGGWLAEGATVVVERERRAEGVGAQIRGVQPPLRHEAERGYGDCVLHYLRHSAGRATADPGA